MGQRKKSNDIIQDTSADPLLLDTTSPDEDKTIDIDFSFYDDFGGDYYG
jgi:hypothetical protein